MLELLGVSEMLVDPPSPWLGQRRRRGPAPRFGVACRAAGRRVLGLPDGRRARAR